MNINLGHSPINNTIPYPIEFTPRTNPLLSNGNYLNNMTMSLTTLTLLQLAQAPLFGTNPPQIDISDHKLFLEPYLRKYPTQTPAEIFRRAIQNHPYPRTLGLNLHQVFSNTEEPTESWYKEVEQFPPGRQLTKRSLSSNGTWKHPGQRWLDRLKIRSPVNQLFEQNHRQKKASNWYGTLIDAGGASTVSNGKGDRSNVTVITDKELDALLSQNTSSTHQNRTTTAKLQDKKVSGLNNIKPENQEWSRPPPSHLNKRAQGKSDQHYRFFTGYDCTAPQNVQAIGFSDLSCQDIRGVPTYRNATYQLLQKQEHIRHDATNCFKIVSRKVHYCGVYDHQTRYPGAEYTRVRQSTTIKECKQASKEGTWTDPHGEVHTISKEGGTIIMFEEAGHTYTNNGELKCKGSTWIFRGKEMKRMVVTLEVEFHVAKETLAIGDREVVAQETNIRLPCQPDDLACETAENTFIWNRIENPCPLSRLRITTGRVVTQRLENGQSETLINHDGEAFMSTDGAMVRLLLKGSTTICKHEVIETNFPDLFLSEIKDGILDKNFVTLDSVFRQIEAAEVSMARYVQNRDSFLAASFTSLLKPELEHMQYVQCQKHLEDRKTKFFLQHKLPGLYTWEIGNGTFGTSAGEVFYVYQCRKVLMEAAETDRCYDALPVRVTKQAKQKPTISSQSKTDPILFLEPLTHRILRHAESIPCSDVFVPKYKNLGGGWSSAGPTVQPTTPPSFAFSFNSFVNEEIELLKFLNTDDPNAGIYTDKALQEMERVMNFHHTKDAVIGTLISQGSAVYAIDSGHISPHDVFPEMPRFSFSIWSSLYNFIYEGGVIFSFFVGVYTLSTIIANLISFFYGIITLRRSKVGCLSGIIWAVLPSIAFWKNFKFAPPSDSYHHPRSSTSRPPTPDQSTSFTSPSKKTRLLDDDYPMRTMKKTKGKPRRAFSTITNPVPLSSTRSQALSTNDILLAYEDEDLPLPPPPMELNTFSLPNSPKPDRNVTASSQLAKDIEALQRLALSQPMSIYPNIITNTGPTAPKSGTKLAESSQTVHPNVAYATVTKSPKPPRPPPPPTHL